MTTFTLCAWRLCERYSDLFLWPLRSLRPNIRIRFSSLITPQLRGRSAVELKPPSVLPDRHAIVAPRRFDGNVTRTDIDQHFLRRALERAPESAATTGFDREAVAVVDFAGLDFARRKGLHRAVVMADEDLIRQRVFAAVQAPGRADRPLDMSVDASPGGACALRLTLPGRRETCLRRRSLGAARDARR